MLEQNDITLIEGLGGARMLFFSIAISRHLRVYVYYNSENLKTFFFCWTFIQ